MIPTGVTWVCLGVCFGVSVLGPLVTRVCLGFDWVGVLFLGSVLVIWVSEALYSVGFLGVFFWFVLGVSLLFCVCYAICLCLSVFFCLSSEFLVAGFF